MAVNPELKAPLSGAASYRLAPMCTMIRIVTLVLLALPIPFALASISGMRVLIAPALFLVLLYFWVWLRYRPTRFVVHQDTLEIVWPLRRQQIARSSISEIRIISARELRGSVGWSMRVGVGGLWGGFGWLWTERRGIVQMYISRIDGLVWIERANERPWLISPERPQEFVQSLVSSK